MTEYQRLKNLPANSGIYTNLRLKIYEKDNAISLLGTSVIDLEFGERIQYFYGLEEDVFKNPKFSLIIETNKRNIKINIDCDKDFFLDLIYHPKEIASRNIKPFLGEYITELQGA